MIVHLAIELCAASEALVPDVVVLVGFHMGKVRRKVRLLQFTMMFLRMSEWLHFVGMRYGGRFSTLFSAPRQSE